MKKRELERLLYARFMKRVEEVKKIRDDFQKELDHHVLSLTHEFGAVALSAFGDKGLKVRQTAEAPRPEKKKKIRRKRQVRQPGQPTIAEVLNEHLPAVIKVVGDRGKDFTAKDVYEHMLKNGFPDTRISASHISLQLGQFPKQFKLKIRKGTSSTGRPINVFNAQR